MISTHIGCAHLSAHMEHVCVTSWDKGHTRCGCPTPHLRLHEKSKGCRTLPRSAGNASTLKTPHKLAPSARIPRLMCMVNSINEPSMHTVTAQLRPMTAGSKAETALDQPRSASKLGLDISLGSPLVNLREVHCATAGCSSAIPCFVSQ